MKNKRKITTAIIAGVTAVALLIGGTFAWQSINQTALNEASDVINPGGRLHDDFDGSNKDVYVENFADEDIFARIQLSEYFAIIANYGKDGAETKTDIAGTATLTGGKITDPTYAIHYFDQANATDEYWNWATGGSTVYMPTFNMNKDSLVADINGTYLDAIGGISNRDGNQYTDYTEYADGDTETGTEIYDGDTDMDDEVGSDFENLANYTDSIVTVENAEHTAANTLNANLISMADWLEMVNTAENGYDASIHGNYWVYDTDGWVYWSAPIAPDTATGLLLDGIELNGVMDDTWYYAINVVAQFVTADDLGKNDNTGFYDTANGTVPTANAESLLGYIGVDTTVDTDSDSSNTTSEEYEYKDGGTITLDGDYDDNIKPGYSYTLTTTNPDNSVGAVTPEGDTNAYIADSKLYVSPDAELGATVIVMLYEYDFSTSGTNEVAKSFTVVADSNTDNTTSDTSSSGTSSSVPIAFGDHFCLDEDGSTVTVQPGYYYTIGMGYDPQSIEVTSGTEYAYVENGTDLYVMGNAQTGNVIKVNLKTGNVSSGSEETVEVTLNVG